jgi:type VI protein secretion system component Hcp
MVLAFTVIAHDEHTGQAAGRSSVSGVTCKKSVDQQALQMAQDALTARRLSSVTLNWQNQLEALLNNAEITSVQFTSDNGAEVVEVTFAYQRAEVAYLPSGTRITF